MLILTRKPNESIIVGESPNQVEIKVVEIKGNRVKLSFEADRSIPIVRSEILVKKGDKP